MRRTEPLSLSERRRLIRRFLSSESWRDPEAAEDRTLARIWRRIKLGLQLGDPEPEPRK